MHISSLVFLCDRTHHGNVYTRTPAPLLRVQEGTQNVCMDFHTVQDQGAAHAITPYTSTGGPFPETVLYGSDHIVVLSEHVSDTFV